MAEAPPPTQAAAPAEREADEAGAEAAHRVELDAFEGPLDLLLHLVKRHEIDLFDIPMAELVQQYLEHVRAIEVLDVDRAGAFLVMAATLVEVKSRTLVPAAGRGDDAKDAAELEEAAAADPRLELVQQLLAYRRFKEAAAALEARRLDWESRHPAAAGRSEAADEDPHAPPPLELDEANAMDLTHAFARAMEAIGHVGDHEVEVDDTPISLHAEDIADRIARDGGEARTLTLGQVIAGRGRGEAIGLFLALLELVRQRRLTVAAGGAADGTETRLSLRDPDTEEELDADAEAEAPDVEDLDAFDWAEPAARERHARRLRLRAQRAAEEAADAPAGPRPPEVPPGPAGHAAPA
ncbi:segregation and condensation protein A [Phycisphaera mikurensis]|uniref:Segregation and condensation protein A n=1 Tax=Phycisphaera mikurensis (strain NBRC 102666 / KCTC 22515 / FYK2301M01) TaxID=1142394 RepID=I0IHJ2_PHYMF|nr:segregation/condensation protein A [Phycisphaera mikurensis]MBB6440974.1 segregation and condensation protein A [Phycisphaera mikurensis]BAM04730.1 segregation and condensation protein A [Phycisphaera mikurensis NBRC 102666]